jgi:tRNA A-37 threonylcarbamoyl transferase component Bud32
MTATQPQSIGRYQVKRALGAGGMGAVYLADDPILKRQLAVKVVRADGGEPGVALQRFQREAEISARLNHPNVITIYDVGEDPALGPFIAMELVEGSSLAELIETSGLTDAADRLAVLIAVMHALGAAHAAGIVHRDIKPANVMVGRDGRVKLMDFGIARGSDMGLTATGAVIGTPAYIAPEQLRGGDPSEVTDRYAFAVMAFELFTGRKPYAGSTTSALLYSIAHAAPVFPESLARPLKKTLERSLAKDPVERFPDMRSFVAALIEANDLDAGALSRLLAGFDSADNRVRQTTPAAVPGHAKTTLLTPAPQMIEGRGAKGVLFGAAALVGIMIAAGIGFYFYSGPPDLGTQAKLESPVPPVEVAEPKPVDPKPKAVEEAVKPPAPPPAPPADAAPVPQAEPAPPPAQAPAPVVAAALQPEAKPAANAPRQPTTSEIRSLVRAALRNHGMEHVNVKMSGERRVALANLKDMTEAERARAVARAAIPEPLEVDTAIRPAPQEVVRRPLTRRPPSEDEENIPQPEAPPPPASSGSGSGWGFRTKGAEKID